ncbi:MAG: hypothetical protein J6Y04_06220 [Bacteroidaceae bacterium]|nr:hypothetical protein [Bacteroidaceae bacterium]
MKKIIFSSIAVILAIAIFTACKGKSTIAEHPFVAGTIDEPLPADSAPAQVLEAMEKAERFHQYEIMSDTANSISVEAIAEADQTPTEGYGIVVVKGATSTTFPNLRNTRQPMASYDPETGTLWLTNSAMEGTGVQVDRLYQIRFDEEDKAYIALTVEPYDIQQALLKRLGYAIEGQRIKLFDNGQIIASAMNTVEDMGDFDDEQPVWIGEQIQYDLSGTTPQLLITPGIKYTTGLVLTYDDMPTLSAPITIADDGQVNIGELKE